jgi:hypothetical protein
MASRAGVLVPETWKGILAGVALGAIMCVLVVRRAFPQSLSLFSGFRIPYVVEREMLRYGSDGSPESNAHLRGFLNGGDWIILSENHTGTSALLNAFRGILDWGRTILIQVAPSFVLAQQSSESVAWHRDYVLNGCQVHGVETADTTY